MNWVGGGVGEVDVDRGLAVNEPARKYALKSLPGREFSGLQLVAMMYVGFKGLDGSTDVGFDLSKEYEQALAMHQAKQG